MKITKSCLAGLGFTKECSLKIGDIFTFDLELMEKHNISICGNGTKIYTVFDIEYYEDLGHLITFEPKSEFAAQINVNWCKNFAEYEGEPDGL